jgi:hypothetical protein
MAIGLIFDGDGMTQEQYFQIFNEVTNQGTEQAPGLLTHQAGPKEGGFCVVETWESPEALQTFFETRLGKALAAAGVQTRPTTFEIVNTQ